jgi:hypothetical protein
VVGDFRVTQLDGEPIPEAVSRCLEGRLSAPVEVEAVILARRGQGPLLERVPTKFPDGFVGTATYEVTLSSAAACGADRGAPGL